MKTVRNIEILCNIFISRNNCTCGGWCFVDYTELHHIQYFQQTTSCYSTSIITHQNTATKKYFIKMNYNASNKTNFYNDKSQYTDQKKNFSLNHTRANHPKCIGWNTNTHLRHLSNGNIPLQQNNRNKTIGFCITEKPA